MFIVIKSEHYDCTNLICKKDTLEEAVAAVKDSMAQRINKNYHTGLTGADITHENEEHYRYYLKHNSCSYNSQSANRRTSRILEVRYLFYYERSFYEQPKKTSFYGRRVYQGFP